MRIVLDVLTNDPDVVNSLRQDLPAVMERVFACMRLIDAMMYFKGFQALQSYHIGHSLWKNGRKSLAYQIQPQASQVFQVDIHPNAVIGAGTFMDHATGIVNLSLIHI